MHLPGRLLLTGIKQIQSGMLVGGVVLGFGNNPAVGGGNSLFRRCIPDKLFVLQTLLFPVKYHILMQPEAVGGKRLRPVGGRSQLL
ncbi:hypothetical protein D3C81_1914950 [compost metagenome]